MARPRVATYPCGMESWTKNGVLEFAADPAERTVNGLLVDTPKVVTSR